MRGKTMLHLAGIGEVLFESSARARRLNISVRGDGRVRVAVPHGVSLSRAQAFTREAGSWLAQQRAKQLARRQRLTADGSLPVLLEDLPKVAEELRQRCRLLAASKGFSPKKITVRCQRSRWGSCSSTGNISLNINLAFLPDDLRDYVIWHELVHLREANHGPRFWQELERCQPGARLLARRLRDYPLLVSGTRADSGQRT